MVSSLTGKLVIIFTLCIMFDLIVCTFVMKLEKYDHE